MNLTDEGLDKIEETAGKQKNITLLFLVDIYRMLKQSDDALKRIEKILLNSTSQDPEKILGELPNAVNSAIENL